MAGELVVKHALIAEYGGKTVILPHIIVNATPFIKVIKKCLALITLCDGRCGKKVFPGTDVFSYLQKKRNDEISRLIKLAANSADPFAEIDCAEADAADDATQQGTRRAELFLKHSLPETLLLSIPEFESRKVKREAVQIQVLATPKVTASIHMEASAFNLTWLRDACTHSWMKSKEGSPVKRTLEVGELQIVTKKVKVKKSDDSKVEMYCNYKKSSGRWSKKSMSVLKSSYDSMGDFSEAVVRMASRLETFRQDNHVGDDSADEASDTEP